MQLVLASRNAGKRHEFEDLLRGTGVVLRTLDEFPDAVDPEELGATFAQNALLKAHAAAEATGLWALGDDSGLCVEALGGRPGIHSARYVTGSDEARWQRLLGELERVPAGERGAAFVCALALCGPAGEAMTEEGRCPGRIALAPRGAHGFGYDPVFEVESDAAARTMAELSTAEKRRVGHRGRAFEALRPHLLRIVRGR